MSPIIGPGTLPWQDPARSLLHQPGPPQGLGPDWLLSPRAHDKRASHRGEVMAVVVVGGGSGGGSDNVYDKNVYP